MLNTSLKNEKIVKKITDFLKKEFKKRKKKKAIIGISGGIDSTLTAFLCKKAGLDLYGLILPYKKINIEESKEALRALSLPKNRVITINIGPGVDAQVKELKKINKPDKVDIGNIMARQRMIVQYFFARRLGGLVVGTENLSEYYLGYFTLYGDQACDISPIAGLWKTEVYQLARYLHIPEELINKKPTAGLWPGQTDEKELGYTYEKADEIMYYSIVKKLSKKEIIKKGQSSDIINKVLKRIKATEYKRQNPPKCLI